MTDKVELNYNCPLPPGLKQGLNLVLKLTLCANSSTAVCGLNSFCRALIYTWIRSSPLSRSKLTLE